MRELGLTRMSPDISLLPWTFYRCFLNRKVPPPEAPRQLMCPQTAPRFLTSFRHFFPNEWPLLALPTTAPTGLSRGKRAIAPARSDALSPAHESRAGRVATTRRPELPCSSADRDGFPHRTVGGGCRAWQASAAVPTHGHGSARPPRPARSQRTGHRACVRAP